MPTRHGPGRPPNPWRPRKIEQDYIEVSEGHHKPATRDLTVKALGQWSDFLRRRGVDTDAVTIHDFIAWEQEQIARGFTRTAKTYNARVRGYYRLKGSLQPDSKWSKLAMEIRGHLAPKPIGKKHPYEHLPLDLLPKILEAARDVKQYTPGSAHGEVYSEAFPLTATFLYGGGRAQWYAITDEQVKTALPRKYIELFVKEGEYVFVPVHDRLLAIWKEHLKNRDFDGPMFFRHGRDPYTYQEGKKDWRADHRAANSNNNHVERIFVGHYAGSDCVERRLEERFGVREDLSSHRFRESVGTYMEAYGFTKAERRLQLSHSAADIEDQYSRAGVEALQVKLSTMDLGSATWVEAHNPPRDLFSGNNGNGGVDQDLVAELRAQLQDERERNHRLEDKLDQLLARSEPRVIA